MRDSAGLPDGLLRAATHTVCGMVTRPARTRCMSCVICIVIDKSYARRGDGSEVAESGGGQRGPIATWSPVRMRGTNQPEGDRQPGETNSA